MTMRERMERWNKQRGLYRCFGYFSPTCGSACDEPMKCKRHREHMLRQREKCKAVLREYDAEQERLRKRSTDT
jgi:hypothetical protein